MKGNAWLAGYIVFTVLLLGGSGYFFAKNKSSYEEKFEGWDELKGEIGRYEKQVPHPNSTNEEQLAGLVADYDGQVKALFEGLARYQRPLNDQMSDNEFANQVLKGKVGDFLKLSAEKKMEVDKKEEFYLGFDAYKSTFPRPEVVPALNYQLEAIEYLLQQLADSGVGRLRFLTRDELPGEVQSDDPEAAKGLIAGQVVQKYPISLGFEADHRAFQEFVNRIANDKNYFFILRLLRVDNSSPKGPNLEGNADGAGGKPIFKKEDGTVATADEMEAKGMSNLPPDQFMAAMAADGWEMQKSDARIIFGQEKLGVFAVVDLVRFLSPDEVDAGEPAETESGEASKGARR